MTTREELKADLLDALRPSTPANVGDIRMESMAEAVLEVVADLIWSKDGQFVMADDPDEPGEFVPITWREKNDRLQVHLFRYQAMAAVLTDLDRCEHGRHEGDPCTLAGGCGGPSRGNPVLLLANAELMDPSYLSGKQVPMRTIGFDLGANPIVVPEHNLTDPDAWRTR